MNKAKVHASLLPLAVAAFALLPVTLLRADDLSAFYTKIDSGEAFEKVSRTRPVADIVVRNVGRDGGRLVFWRGSSYLPYWEVDGNKWFFEELTERAGDGPENRPDNVNTFSHVRIVESTPEQVVVHWRYLPMFEGRNPHFNATNLSFHPDVEPKHLVETTNFVDEYYTIKSDGSVIRTFKKGTEHFDAWADPENHLTHEITLSRKGIEVTKVSPAKLSVKSKRVKGSLSLAKTVIPPVRTWSFNEGVGDTTTETVSGAESRIEGHQSYWKRGVSGTCLAFDGYNSAIRVPASEAPAITEAVSLEAWVALGAYPWNWTPVIQQGHEESYSLAIGPHGHVAMSVKLGSEVIKIESTRVLERKRWYQVAGTYDAETGNLSVFIDGEACGERTVAGQPVAQSDAPIQIGQGKKMRQSDPVRGNTFVDSFSFDGLIDEVRVYDSALTAEQLAASYQAFDLDPDERARPDLEPRVLPSGKHTGQFGAQYTRLKFYDTWDGMFRFGDHPDVVIEFDQHPTSFVFWRGVCYVPMIVNEQGEWYSNEFNETWNRSGGKGCQEPMSDKESFSNHVRILENTAARCVVQLRYPLVDVLHTIANYDEETGWGDWSDWVYTIYPDGVAAKEMICWTDGSSRHEWQEGMVITGPDQHPEQVVETDPALRLITLDGELRDYSWKTKPPKGVDYKDTKIHVINYKEAYDPFTIGYWNRGDVYRGEVTEYSVFPSWNHWPVAQMPSDGRYAKHPDRTSHSSLTHVYGTPEFHDLDAPYKRMLMLEGMSTKSPEELITLTKSWMHAPAASAPSGCELLSYSAARREYPIVAKLEDMRFTIEADAEHPIENLCFTVRNWGHKGDAEVLINGEVPQGLRQGVAIDTDGHDYLVVWVDMQSTGPVEVSVRGAQPSATYTAPEHIAQEAIRAQNAQSYVPPKRVRKKKKTDKKAASKPKTP